MPTGDPLIPADVRLSKHIRYMMAELADMGDVEEADTISNASFGASAPDNIANHDKDTPD